MVEKPGAPEPSEEIVRGILRLWWNNYTDAPRPAENILRAAYRQGWRAGREIGIKQAQQAKRHGEGREER
jgi:hypothetical protein